VVTVGQTGLKENSEVQVLKPGGGGMSVALGG